MSPRRSPALEARFRRMAEVDAMAETVRTAAETFVHWRPPGGTVRLTLPWPPSVNSLYATYRGRRLLSVRGREYHELVGLTVCASRAKQHALFFAKTGRLRVVFRAFPPDRRKRDLSNLLKVMEDALTHAGVWGDDSQIDDLRIVRGAVDAPKGRVEVEIEEVAA